MNPPADALMARFRRTTDTHLAAASNNLRAIKRHIPIHDESTTEQAEIAWGKNLNTGDWTATIYFGDLLDKEFDHE